MKRSFYIPLVILAMFLIAAQTIVELPDELQQLLAVAAGIAATFILTQFAKVLKTDLSGWKAQLTATIITAAMVVINAVLSKIPPNFESIATAVMQLIVVLLGAFGLYRVLMPKKPA